MISFWLLSKSVCPHHFSSLYFLSTDQGDYLSVTRVDITYTLQQSLINTRTHTHSVDITSSWHDMSMLILVLVDMTCQCWCSSSDVRPRPHSKTNPYKVSGFCKPARRSRVVFWVSYLGGVLLTYSTGYISMATVTKVTSNAWLLQLLITISVGDW